MARIFVFRPHLSDELVDESPKFVLKGIGESQLALETYAYFDVPPGTHSFSVTPESGESKLWRVQGNLSIQNPGRYYLVIWNGGKSKSGESSNPASSALAVQNPIAGAIAGGLTAMLLSYSGNRYVRFEVIDESSALDELRRCRFMPTFGFAK
jgi:hypothetical protein